jgi:chitin synthase
MSEYNTIEILTEQSEEKSDVVMDINIPNDNSEEDDEDIREINMSSGRENWMIVSNLSTCCVPNCLLNRLLSKNQEVRQAWREKVTFFIIFIMFSVLFIFIVTIVPKLLCNDEGVYTWKNIYKNKGGLMILNGKVLDAETYSYKHPGPSNIFKKYYGKDISDLFEKPNYKVKSEAFIIYPYLLNLFLEYKNNDTSKYCSLNYCHQLSNFTNTFNNYVIGDLIVTYAELKENKNTNWIVLYNKVYNISDYVLYGHPVYPSRFDYETKPKSMAYYLDERLNTTILNRLGQDATILFEELFSVYDREEIIKYLDRLYYTGTIDTRYNQICATFDVVYFIILGFISCLLILTFLLALCILNKQYSKGKSKYVVIFVSCYTEDHNSIEKTIHSICDSKYSDKKKLLFIVVDGVIKGKGNDKTTAEITLNILGRSLNEEIIDCKYKCIHEVENYNRARVYSGYYENNKHSIPYIVIVKTGLDSEEKSSKRGNRGKRDSQMILFSLLNRYYYKKQKNQLDNKILESMTSNNLNIENYEFFQSVDADTFLRPDALKYLVYRMKDDDIYGVCGETLISNKIDSFVSAIQVYEYYFSHNLNKAFESFFSSVTCMPGCFSMYRIRTNCHRKKPIIIHNKLLDEYSDVNIDTLFKKNLISLGEDRFFTTLITKYFPQGKLKYIVEAKCETTVPNKFSVIVSQRRRWNNSTITNNFYRMFIKNSCGVCCCSMNFIIFISLITTLFLPASCCYLYYLIYAFTFGYEPVNITFITMTSVIIGIQILIFIIKRDFIYIVWLLLYLLTLPLWMIFLPVYSFAKLDDFSWGNTRKVDEEK